MSKILPNSYTTPNFYIDELMDYLTAEEWKVLSYAARHILGFHDRIPQNQHTMSISHFQNGLGKYRGCGLGRAAIMKALDSLAEFGILRRVGSPTAKGQTWEIVVDDTQIDVNGLRSRQAKRTSKNRKRTQKARAEKGEAVCPTDPDPVVCPTNQQAVAGLCDKPAVVCATDQDRSVGQTHTKTTTKTTSKTKEPLAATGKVSEASGDDAIQEPTPDTPVAWDAMRPGEQHAAMKTAIVAGLGWEPEHVTNWGEIDQVSKKLRKAGATLPEMVALGAYVRARHSDPRPAFMAADYPEFKRRQTAATLTPEQDALRVGLLAGYGIDDPAAQDPRINAIARWLAADVTGDGKIEVGKLPHPAAPEHVSRFFTWYRQAYPEVAAPMDFVKFTTQWRKFASSAQKRPQTPVYFQPETITVVDPERAKQLAAQRKPDFMTGGDDAGAEDAVSSL